MVDNSLVDNGSDNEVFNSTNASPSFDIERPVPRPRRVTGGVQSYFSTGDLPSLVEQDSVPKSRPKSFFPQCGNELLDWQKSDSSDLSDHLHSIDASDASELKSLSSNNMNCAHKTQ